MGTRKVAIVLVVIFSFVICALAAVRPVLKFNVADVIFVDTKLVFNSVEMVEVVTFAFVICALAVVTPVVKSNVADVIFVAVRVTVSVRPITSNAPVVIATENLAEPTTSNANDGEVVPIPTFPVV